MSNKILVEVAYATPQKQIILECETSADSPAREVVRHSGIEQHFGEIDLDSCDIGVFGKAVADDYRVSEGDRIEIYRALIADPKEVRRQRAARGLQTKKGGGAITQD